MNARHFFLNLHNFMGKVSGPVCGGQRMPSESRRSNLFPQIQSKLRKHLSKNQLLPTFSLTAWPPPPVSITFPLSFLFLTVYLYPWARPALPCCRALPLPASLSRLALFTMCFVLALQANGHSFLHMEHETAVSLLKNFPKTVDLVILRESTT